MSFDPLIRAERVGKRYAIFDRPQHRLKQMLVPRLRRAIGLAPRRYYRDFWALRDVTFDVARGETLGIMGRNGSGKSTLLQLVCGILNPTEGSVATFGRVAGLLELGSGFNPEFTGRENVYLNSRILGMSDPEIDACHEDIVSFAAIGDFIERPVKLYSSGMFIRLAFAVAAHSNPDILVIDEALAVGDIAFQSKCLGRIREMQRRGVGIVLVSHSPNSIVEYCDRAIYLRRGQLVMSGGSREVAEFYANDIVAEEGGIAVPAHPAEVHAEYSYPMTGSGVPAAVLDGGLGNRPKTEILGVSMTDGARRERGTFSFGDELLLRVRVRFNEPNRRPCFGVLISSVDGIALWSATTAGMDIPIQPQPDAAEREFVWRLRLNLAGNRFVVAVGAGDIASGEYRRHHRLEYAGHFDVLPLSKAGGGWLGIVPSFEADGDLRPMERRSEGLGA
jgi:lipopolysaccharide transport system ATP-binding protein